MADMASGTGFVFEENFIAHQLAPGHPESPERLIGLRDKLRQTGLDKRLLPVTHVKEEEDFIRLVHSESHINSVLSLPVTGAAARLAVAASLGAVRDVCQGNLCNAFCALRPPGHHAHNQGANADGPGQGEGFCFFNNIAVAARYAQKKHRIKRVLIADWDYHHGNGTEWAFYGDSSVLFFSTHDGFAYPGTGSTARKGQDKGQGYNINIPLYPGAGDEEVINAFKNVLVPAADAFKPGLVLISAGFDSREHDTLGLFNITDDGFQRLTQIVKDIAAKHCGGRIVSFLEGGYNIDGLAEAVCTHINALLN